jgi:hypothetical protein
MRYCRPFWIGHSKESYDPRELEWLGPHIVKPPGNNQKDGFAMSEDPRRRFKRACNYSGGVTANERE